MTPTAPGNRLRWRRALAGIACAGALAVAPTGCGSDDPDEDTNGIGELPPAEIEQRARTAAAEAATVRLSGTVITESGSYRLDVRLGEEGGVGEVSAEDTTFELLRVGEDLYIKADAAFWESEGIPEELESDPAEKLDDKYVLVAPDDPAYAELSGFTDKNTLLDGLLTLEGERATGERGEIDGVATIRVEADGGAGGAMEVSLVGTPYPLRLERGGQAGELTMDDWGEEFSLHAPNEDEIVDYGDAMITPDE
ncbi:hypothetical protein [Streptomyces litchfieldiae]|uniref:Lipoprotein n=1 Tax=Streptomyces litchfieldiae TaxID=3075543 RepID=A0ABU2MM26_9ACTN|nr:hypothetical protein [Streptomyces sp. DSM 44938]MDT0342526.1 hypothetical protein [Streptomyces sp. DSM 44938]